MSATATSWMATVAYAVVGLFVGRKAYHYWWANAHEYDRDNLFVCFGMFGWGFLLWPVYLLWWTFRKPIIAFITPPQEKERQAKAAAKKEKEALRSAAWDAVRTTRRLRDEADDEVARESFNDLAERQAEYARTYGPEEVRSYPWE